MLVLVVKVPTLQTVRELGYDCTHTYCHCKVQNNRKPSSLSILKEVVAEVKLHGVVRPTTPTCCNFVAFSGKIMSSDRLIS